MPEEASVSGEERSMDLCVDDDGNVQSMICRMDVGVWKLILCESLNV